jgi:flagellar motor switch/type III secretory pathway protein FliN
MGRGSIKGGEAGWLKFGTTGGELSDSLEQGMSEAQRMLQEAVAALDASNLAMHEVGLHPLELRDWSGDLPDLQRHSSPTHSTAFSGLQTIEDVGAAEQELRIEFGRVQVDGQQLIRLAAGDVLTRVRASDAPVDIWVGAQRLAQGEVLVLDGKLCVRVTELEVAAMDALKRRDGGSGT